jgi:hypothetical protein
MRGDAYTSMKIKCFLLKNFIDDLKAHSRPNSGPKKRWINAINAKEYSVMWSQSSLVSKLVGE